MFERDPFFARRKPHFTPFVSIARGDPNDPSCTSSSHSSSYKVSFESKGKNAQGKTTVERKNVDYATKDGKTVRDTFQHYKISEDAQGKYVDVFDPTGTVVDKEYVEGKKDKVSRIAAVIKKHPQKIGPHLRSDDECTSIADKVQKTLDAGEPSLTKRASTLSRKRSRSRSVSSSSKPRARARSSSSKTRRAH